MAEHGGRTRKSVQLEDIQLVHNLIERCMKHYLSEQEIIAVLQQQAKIEPAFTRIVWAKLEEQNPEFFRAYYTRLRLKDQIVFYNYLLERQQQLLREPAPQPELNRLGTHSAGMDPATESSGAATSPVVMDPHRGMPGHDEPAKAARDLHAYLGMEDADQAAARGLSTPLGPTSTPGLDHADNGAGHVPRIPSGLLNFGHDMTNTSPTFGLNMPPLAATQSPPLHSPLVMTIAPEVAQTITDHALRDLGSMPRIASLSELNLDLGSLLEEVPDGSAPVPL
ncbi:unnamed protein product [Pedinophyceae sp. YPF-701]|nr:unnamed protein product [Pedinophyceae sp. YPF-701]